MIRLLIILTLFISCEKVVDQAEVYGCTIEDACNFDSDANVYDGTCWFADLGCECSQGPGCGCTDPDACNYNINATDDSGYCWSTSDTGCPCGYGVEAHKMYCSTGEENCWTEEYYDYYYNCQGETYEDCWTYEDCYWIETDNCLIGAWYDDCWWDDYYGDYYDCGGGYYICWEYEIIEECITYEDCWTYYDYNCDGQWIEYEVCEDEYEYMCFQQEFNDINGDGIWNEGEEFVDENENGIWDWYDLNGNGIYDQGDDAESFLDTNENGTYDEPEPLTECPDYSEGD